MPNVLTRTQAPGKSLPAELVVGGGNGYRRILQNGEVVQQRGKEWAKTRGQGHHYGIQGIGLYDYGGEYGYGDGSGPVVVPAGDPGFDWGGLIGVINAGSTDIAKILAASNPGTIYRDPQGNVIYSQPTGNTQNLPVGGGGPSGTINTPLGSGSFSGISTTTLMMFAVVGLLAVMVMKK